MLVGSGRQDTCRYTLPVQSSPAPAGGPGRVSIPVVSEGRCTQNMRAYELMVIIRGALDEADAQKWVTTVTQGITSAGGTVHGKPDWWGKRRFAYAIDHQEEGYYVVIELLAEGGALDGLERSLRIADDVVRHKLIRLPDAEAERRGMASTAA